MKKLSYGLIILSFVFLSLDAGLLDAPMAEGQEPPPLPQGLGPSLPTEEQAPILPQGLSEGRGSEQGEPGLPAGLQGEPQLPGGIEGQSEPRLPGGLEETAQPPEPTPPEKKPPAWARLKRGMEELGFSGFWEARGGLRIREDAFEKDASLGETRLQVGFEPTLGQAVFNLTADFLYDPVLDDHRVDLESGHGWLDLREANMSLSPLTFMDLKAGRQILTWGTGDLIFVNDLFPKDWQAFFIGRDEEYLKAPSDALKASFFSQVANLDLVYVPAFDHDRFISGERLSYYNVTLGRVAGRDSVIEGDFPNGWFEDDEIAIRISRNLGAYELSLYGYKGFWKSPGGSDPRTGKALFPRLNVYGGSVRGPLGRGIANIEIGYYDSREDRSGENPFENNSEFRFLAGYEMDLPQVAHDLTLGLQYYLELLLEYKNYTSSLTSGMPIRDEYRHLMTLRLTKLLMNQNLTLSIFAFYSPSDSDAYLRPKVHYKITDHWSAEVGGNWFLGSSNQTFFGQFEDNSNVYCAIRYGF